MARAFDSIKQGLNEAIAHAKSKDRKAKEIKLYQPQAVDVSSLRERLSLTQEQFAALWLLGRYAAPLGARRTLTQRSVTGFAQRD